VIVEMGARQPGDIAELTNMASADTVCCLNAGNAHIGIFGSYQTLLKTKLEIFSKGPSQSTLVANFDQKDVLQGALSTGKNIVTFGQSEGADIRILEVQWTSKGELIIGFDVLGSPFSLTCGSAHVSYPINIAAALAMAVAARVPVAPLSSSLVNFKGVDGRYKVQDFDRFTIIDDCYNASPASMIAGFQSMVKSYPERKKILVLGDMLELGELSQSSHFDVGKEAVKLVDPELLVCIGQESLQTAAGAQSAGIDAKHLIHLESVDQLITKEIKYTDFGDLIYIKGSRGIKLDKFLKSLHL
jgi:UDP-N-acetylmuramoyl-tripeptide--D-alanyl-D-alanine ligase